MGKQYTVEQFKTVCETKPEQSKKVLVETLGLTPDGVKSMVEQNPETAVEFFGKMNAEFDVDDEAQVKAAIESCLESADNMAETMSFIYNNFDTNKKTEPAKDDKADATEDGGKKPRKKREKKAKSEGTGEKKKPKPPKRPKTDWYEQEIPFGAGGTECLAFVELKDFAGTKKEFLAHLKGVFEEKGIKSSPSAILNHTIKNVHRRGWEVKLDPETQKFSVRKKSPEEWAKDKAAGMDKKKPAKPRKSKDEPKPTTDPEPTGSDTPGDAAAEPVPAPVEAPKAPAEGETPSPTGVKKADGTVEDEGEVTV